MKMQQLVVLILVIGIVSKDIQMDLQKQMTIVPTMFHWVLSGMNTDMIFYEFNY